MPDPENIVHQDSQITQILEYRKGSAASALFERYRISGVNQDAFVSALIGRLCVLEARCGANFERGQNTFPAPASSMDTCTTEAGVL
jgi:hypothetical protein